MGQAYETVNRMWKKTTKMLLGDEIGELEEFDRWLGEFVDPVNERKSSASGKEIYFAVPHYCEGGRFISLDEVDFNRRFEPLNINEIKDIDSISEALNERFAYCGNIVLANSRNFEKSSNIQSSFHVYKSNYLYGCEYVAYGSQLKNCKYIFTANSNCASNFLVMCPEGFKSNRLLGCWRSFNCSDCYCCYGAESCQDVMFSFNVKNRRNIIGNLELPPDRYSNLKQKLIEDIREELSAKKYLPSIIEMAGDRPPEIPDMESEDSDEEADMAPIERAFGNTSRAVLGKELRGIRDYENWLMRYIPAIHTLKSAATGKVIYKSRNLPLSVLPDDKLVRENEAKYLSRIMRLDEGDLQSLESVREALWKIGLFMPEARLGDVKNAFEAPLVNQSINCYKGGVYNDSKNCACCFWPRNSEYVFGSQMAVESASCINCHNSLRLSRAFEVDSCSNCSGIYFSHNCENVQDGMFCFNVKNLRNGIGNAEYPADRFREMKGNVLSQIVDELEKKKELKWSIFNLGCR